MPVIDGGAAELHHAQMCLHLYFLHVIYIKQMEVGKKKKKKTRLVIIIQFPSVNTKRIKIFGLRG